MNRLPAFAALALFGLGGCSSGANTAEFARVENARFVIPYASSYFVGQISGTEPLAAEGPNADREPCLCRELDLHFKRSDEPPDPGGIRRREGVVSKVEPILQTAPASTNESARRFGFPTGRTRETADVRRTLPDQLMGVERRAIHNTSNGAVRAPIPTRRLGNLPRIRVPIPSKRTDRQMQATFLRSRAPHRNPHEPLYGPALRRGSGHLLVADRQRTPRLHGRQQRALLRMDRSHGTAVERVGPQPHGLDRQRRRKRLRRRSGTLGAYPCHSRNRLCQHPYLAL